MGEVFKVRNRGKLRNNKWKFVLNTNDTGVSIRNDNSFFSLYDNEVEIVVFRSRYMTKKIKCKQHATCDDKRENLGIKRRG